ncbi:MAG: hypothetical protein KAZ87_14810 [Spirochaetes bacterium]|nr:hypothetical protein [Spirochaetota bacterium]
MLKNDIKDLHSWVISGSALNWGDFLLDEAQFFIKLYVEKEKRIERLKIREKERFGNRIDIGNDMYEQYVEFINWASSYESGNEKMRSLLSENKWLEKAKGYVLKINSDIDLNAEIESVDEFFKKYCHACS